MMQGKTIKRFRMTHGITQEELGKLIGVPAVTLSAYETGRYDVPRTVEHKMNLVIEEFGIDNTLIVTAHKYIAPHKKPGRVKQKANGVEEPKKEEENVIPLTTQSPVALPPSSNHYNGGNPDHIDVLKFSEVNFTESENIGFYRISAIKYLARYGKKNGYNPEDLEKALYYINKLKEVTQ